MSAEPGRPWWATEDPAGHQSGEASSHGEHARPAWLDAVEAIDGAVRAATRSARERSGSNGNGSGDDGSVSGEAETNGHGPSGGDGGSGPTADGHRHGAIDAYCHVCPVCSLLRALDDTRPEVILHLTEAARHLTMAAKAVVDSQADRAGGAAGDDFQSIPVDD